MIRRKQDSGERIQHFSGTSWDHFYLLWWPQLLGCSLIFSVSAPGDSGDPSLIFLTPQLPSKQSPFATISEYLKHWEKMRCSLAQRKPRTPKLNERNLTKPTRPPVEPLEGTRQESVPHLVMKVGCQLHALLRPLSPPHKTCSSFKSDHLHNRWRQTHNRCTGLYSKPPLYHTDSAAHINLH